MPFLPPAKSNRWFTWFPAYAFVTWLPLLPQRFVLDDVDFSLTLALRLAVFALAVSAILSLFGWLGARYVWLLATAGNVIGLILLFAYGMRDMDGWEDLAGLLTYFLFLGGGFILGLIVEGFARLVRRR